MTTGIILPRQEKYCVSPPNPANNSRSGRINTLNKRAEQFFYLFHFINEFIELIRVFTALPIIALLAANNSTTLINQEIQNKSPYDKPYGRIYNVYQHYIFDSDGTRIVSVNFNQYGKLVSKTTYRSRETGQTYIIDQDCKFMDCDQFKH